MHVDLGDYRYLLMENPGAEPHTVSLVASSSTTAGFLHVTEVFASTAEPITPAAPPSEAPVVPNAENAGLIDVLLTEGHAILPIWISRQGLRTWGPALSDADHPCGLAGKTPTARVVLVGHTDAIGSLAANEALPNGARPRCWRG